MFHNKGFIGVDKHPKPKEQRQPGATYIQLDFIKDKLPWEKNSADEIVCFHVIEHLERAEGIELLKRIHYLLKPGKQAFITCPDTKYMIERYMEDDYEFFNKVYPKNGKLLWEGETLLDRLFYSMYDKREYGHNTPYDMKTLFDAASQAGWKDVSEMPKGHHWFVDKSRSDYEMGIILRK